MEPVKTFLAGIDAISTMVRDAHIRHDEQVAKARKLGQPEPAEDLPRATSVQWVRRAAKRFKECEAPRWLAHAEVVDEWDPIGATLAGLRKDPEFVTIEHCRIDVRWSSAAWVDQDVAGARVVMGRVAVVGAEERDTWPDDGDEPPSFRFRLSAPAFALASPDEVERALHELLVQCGFDGRPVKRKPDIVAHAATLARYGAIGIREAQAVACAMRHPETRAAMTRYRFDPVSGQGLLWAPRSPRQASLEVA